MIFSGETPHNFFKLLRQTMDAMKSHQQPHLIYSVDETGLKLTYSSDNQKLFSIKGRKRFTVLLMEEKEKL
jgi:hypothetical protein